MRIERERDVMRRAIAMGGVLLAIAAGVTATAQGQATPPPAPVAIVTSSDCVQHALPRNDDSYSSVIPLPFAANFYGQTYEQLWVNNNGNVTFDGPLST